MASNKTAQAPKPWKRVISSNALVDSSCRNLNLEPEGTALAPLVLTVSEAAHLLRCSQEVVYQLIYSSQLRALRPSRRFIIPRAALDAFLRGAYKPDQ